MILSVGLSISSSSWYPPCDKSGSGNWMSINTFYGLASLLLQNVMLSTQIYEMIFSLIWFILWRNKTVNGRKSFSFSEYISSSAPSSRRRVGRLHPKRKFQLLTQTRKRKNKKVSRCVSMCSCCGSLPVERRQINQPKLLPTEIELKKRQKANFKQFKGEERSEFISRANAISESAWIFYAIVILEIEFHMSVCMHAKLSHGTSTREELYATVWISTVLANIEMTLQFAANCSKLSSVPMTVKAQKSFSSIHSKPIVYDNLTSNISDNRQARLSQHFDSSGHLIFLMFQFVNLPPKIADHNCANPFISPLNTQP